MSYIMPSETTLEKKMSSLNLLFSLFEELPSETQMQIGEVLANVPPEVDIESIAKGIKKLLDDNPITFEWIKRILNQVRGIPMKRLIENFIIGSMVVGWKKRYTFVEKFGHPAPYTIVINPTMRCNLRCTGCYAFNYDKHGDMDYDLLSKVLNEAKEMGVRFITLSGGEPLMFKDIWRMLDDFNDMIFMMYTNGTKIDDECADKLRDAGNVFPAFSVEGFEKETDQRRGRGIYRRVLDAMARLKERGVFFGFSATPVKYNSDILSSDEFIDYYVEKGCLFGWFFNYIPVGLDPDIDLMPTPEQRDNLRKKTIEWLKTKPIFLGDFWNDGACVGGCLSGSRYCYITVEGYIQPCTFVHFYTHTIQDTTLEEVFQTKLFKMIRSVQPYSTNLLKPCKIIDNPEFLRKVIEECGAKPSYEGADQIIKEEKIRTFLDWYAKRWGELADAAWRSDDYKEGKEVLIPFIGKQNVWKYYDYRMENATNVEEKGIDEILNNK